MSISDNTYVSFSNEDGIELISGLIENRPDVWTKFLGDNRVKLILEKALRATCLWGKVNVMDLANAIYLHTVTEDNRWLASDKKNPGAIFDYFAKTVRSLLHRRKFMRSFLGFDPMIDRHSEAIDVAPENNRSLEERLSDQDNEDVGREIARKKVQVFEEIITLVGEKKADYGELLHRYYIQHEDLRAIAIDYMRRGLIKGRRYKEEELTEEEIQKAHDNLQNARLARAREKFNEIALAKDFPLLEGKIKKSMFKETNKANI